jgi:signal transduction histidine kinase
MIRGLAESATLGMLDGMAIQMVEDQSTEHRVTDDRAARQRRATNGQQMPATSVKAAVQKASILADMIPRLTLQAAGPLQPSWADLSQSDLHSPSSFAHAALRRALTERTPVVVLNSCALSAQSDGVENEDGGKSRADHLAEETAPPQMFEDVPIPYQALLIAPIAVHEEVYGCLMLFYAMRWQFAPDDVALAIAYADQIALAIANARLQMHIAQAATEAERARLARELHDTVTQDLYSASLLAEALPRVWDQDPADVVRALGQLHEISQSGLATLRLLLLELRPDGLDEMALPALLRLLLNAMRTRAGVPLSLDITGEEDSWPLLTQEVKHAFYRMAQEAVTNAVKYAAATRIVVRLHRAERRAERRVEQGTLRMEIEDDGVGFDPRASTPGHFGLAMMRERAHAVGATVRVESHAGQGTRLVIAWSGTETGHDEAHTAARQQSTEQEKGVARE